MQKKIKLIFIITQFYKGGAEMALLNLINSLPENKYDIDFLILDQVILPDTVTLNDQVKNSVTVCDAAADEGLFAFVKKVFFRIWRKITQKSLTRKKAKSFVKNKEYDFAFSWGEWLSPEFVSKHVNAKKKAVWIHTDVDKSYFTNEDILFGWDEYITNYIFVSEHSKDGAIKKYPLLKTKAFTVHNMLDEGYVNKKSEVDVNIESYKKTLLTVGNVRKEKNHMRQLEVMRYLQEMGREVTWLNIGNTTNKLLIGKIKKKAKQYGLEDKFLLLGVDDNPYKYIKKVAAVTVLSDYESWSMVITESKLLATPVIATPTSGAKEQIESGKTGIITSFDAKEIAKDINNFFIDTELSDKIRKNLEDFTTEQKTISEFEELINASLSKTDLPSLLYISDDINYVSGAQKATAFQINKLKNSFNIEIYSIAPPKVEAKKLFKGATFIEQHNSKYLKPLTGSFSSVMRSKEYSFLQKLCRVSFAILARINKHTIILDYQMKKELTKYLNKFDTVCVLSEASKMREFVSDLSNPKKIQWIHTDYKLWRDFSSWTKDITKNDNTLYAKYDKIVCLTEISKRGFLEIHPHLANKVVVINNSIPYKEILEKSRENFFFQKNKRPSILTVGRVNDEKAFDRVLRICSVAKNKNLDFHWYIIGEGPSRKKLELVLKELNINDCITFLGEYRNPYPAIKQADLFALLSTYEGTPVTIDEAMVLGTPIFTTAVGGISEQLKGIENAVIVKNEEKEITKAFIKILEEKSYKSHHPVSTEYFKKRNEKIILQLKEVFKK